MADIVRGSRLMAPLGFSSIGSSETVHFLAHSTSRPRVLLVSFQGAPEPKPVLHILGRKQFEDALLQTKRLCVVDTGAGAPHWLRIPDGKRSDADELARRARAATYKGISKARLDQIKPLIDRFDSVMEAADPMLEIGRLAREHLPDQHSTRIKLWVVAYWVFGEHGVQAKLFRIGRWARLDHAGTKRGRPSLCDGRHHGANIGSDLGQVMADGFVKHGKECDTWSRIYGKVMTCELGLIEHRTSDGRFRYVHPDGGKLPSSNQFRYWVLKHIPLIEVQRILYGEARANRRCKALAKSFREDFGQLYERVEEDCFVTEKYPKSFISNKALPKLHICRLRCVTSGMLLGIGCSFGSETRDAYRMALLCASMDKVLFCALFNVRIQHDQWPALGLSPNRVTDRGPGVATFEGDIAPVRKMAPSNSPRSKASIEASNPKKIAREGSPVVELSNLTPVQMFADELHALLEFNVQTDMSAHASPEIVASGVALNPLGLFRFYSERARTVAMNIPFEQAVRRYMIRDEGKLSERGVDRHGQMYCSDRLRASGYLDRVVNGGTVSVEIYFMAMCVRYIWVDIAGELMELAWEQAARACEEQYAMTLEEQLEMEEKIKVDASAARQSHAATSTHHDKAFEQEAGVKRHGGRTVRGPLPKSKKASAEAAALRSLNKGKKAA
jgi:hypothetical protein